MHNLQTFSFVHHNLEWRGILTLPNHIWNMKQLRHLRLHGSTYLPNPYVVDELGLQHLQELSSLCLASCTKEVFLGLPHLKKLRIYDIGEKYKALEETCWSLLYLNKLRVLECSFDEGNSLWLNVVSQYR